MSAYENAVQSLINGGYPDRQAREILSFVCGEAQNEGYRRGAAAARAELAAAVAEHGPFPMPVGTGPAPITPDREQIRAELMAEFVAWLVKRAREHRVQGPQYAKQADVIGMLASKVQRGAVRPDNLLSLPAQGGPEDVPALRAELDRLSDELTGANLTAWEDSRECLRLRLAWTSAQRGRRVLRARYEQLDQALDEVMAQRDAHHDALDRFALAVAPEEVIGEHSSGNNPWANAFELVTPAAEVDALRARVAELEAAAEAYPGELAMLRGLLGVLRVVAAHGDMCEVRRLIAEHAADEQAAYAEDPCRPCGCPKRFDRHADGCPTLPEVTP